MGGCVLYMSESESDRQPRRKNKNQKEYRCACSVVVEVCEALAVRLWFVGRDFYVWRDVCGVQMYKAGRAVI